MKFELNTTVEVAHTLARRVKERRLQIKWKREDKNFPKEALFDSIKRFNAF